MPTIEDFGFDGKELLVGVARETMGKLIAAEKEIERLKSIIGLTDEEVAKYGDRAELVVAVEYWVNRRGGDAGAEEIVMATIAAMHNAGWRPPVSA